MNEKQKLHASQQIFDLAIGFVKENFKDLQDGSEAYSIRVADMCRKFEAFFKQGYQYGRLDGEIVHNTISQAENAPTTVSTDPTITNVETTLDNASTASRCAVNVYFDDKAEKILGVEVLPDDENAVDGYMPLCAASEKQKEVMTRMMGQAAEYLLGSIVDMEAGELAYLITEEWFCKLRNQGYGGD